MYHEQSLTMEIMILSVFGDESSDERQERVFTVSGVCGTSAEWSLAIKEWMQITKGEEFHASDWETAGRHDEYCALAESLGRGIVAGFTVSLDLISFSEIFPNRLRDTGYYQCFSKILDVYTSNAAQWNNRVAADPSCGDPSFELEFTFDHRKASQGNAGTLYASFVKQPEWKDANILNRKVSFDCRTNPRIQIADLVAREAMKELDRKISTPGLKKRKQLVYLERRGAFKFVELDRNYCLCLREQLQKNDDEPGYWEWLRRTRRVQHGKPHDNYGNRFSYYIYLLQKEAQEGSLHD